MKCTKCNAEIDINTKFCSNCGARVKYTERNIVVALISLIIVCAAIGTLVINKNGMKKTDEDNAYTENIASQTDEDNADIENIASQTDGIDEANIRLLHAEPFEDNQSNIDLFEYEITGGIKEDERGYKTYTVFPANMEYITIPEAFRIDGGYESLTVGKKEPQGGSDGGILIQVGSTHSYVLLVGKNWDGESAFCYICHGKESDCLVIESSSPISSAVGSDTYYIGQDNGDRVESIRIIELDDFSEMTYELRYRQNQGYTIEEKINDSQGETQYQWLYYQNAPNHIYNYPESVCDSYDAAIEYIQEKLSKYGLESRVGWNCNNSEEPDMVTVFVEHRDGIRQDVPLNSIASAELTDKMYWGINSQFLTTESNSDISESTKLNSIYGVWDSGDGDTRLRFYNATGSDVAVSDGRLIEVEGTLTIINFRTGEKEYGSYILDEDAIMLVLNTKQYKFNCSLENDELIIDDDTFYKVDDVIVNQLIGTWENDDLKIEFGERDELKMYDKTGNRSAINGIYAILNESELWLSNEYEGTTSITNYSVDGGVLDCNGKKLYRNGIGKENIVGTWVNNDDSLGKYYVLNTDGSYEYYLTEQSYSLGRPEEEGTYEIANENDIYFYQNDYRFAYTYLEYNVDGTLSNSSGKQYTKIQ